MNDSEMIQGLNRFRMYYTVQAQVITSLDKRYLILKCETRSRFVTHIQNFALPMRFRRCPYHSTSTPYGFSHEFMYSAATIKIFEFACIPPIRAHEIKQIPTGIAGLIDMVKKPPLAWSHFIWFWSRGAPGPQSWDFSDWDFSTQKAQNHKNKATSILKTF